MKPTVAARVTFQLLGSIVKSARQFFVHWFLPLPAVEKLEDDERWKLDEDDSAQAEPEQQHRPVDQLTVGEQLTPDPAPEIRPPEGADERAGRQPNMPNPFA